MRLLSYQSPHIRQRIQQLNPYTHPSINNTHYIASGDTCGIIYIWSLVTRRSIIIYNINEQSTIDPTIKHIKQITNTNNNELNGILSIHWIQHNELIIQCKIGIILHYTIDYSNKIFTLQHRIHTHQYSFCKCTIDIANNILYSTGDNASILYMYDLNTYTLINKLQCEKLKEQTKVSVIDETDDTNDNEINEPTDKTYGMIMYIHILPHHTSYIICGMESGHINMYDIKTKQCIQSYKSHNDPVMSISIQSNPNNTQQYTLLSCSAGSSVVELSIDMSCIEQCKHISDNTVLQYVNHITQPQSHTGISDVSIRHDLAVYGTACWDYHIRLYRMSDHTLLCTLHYHTQHVYCITFMDTIPQYAELGIIITGSKDGKIAVWQLYNNKRLSITPDTNNSMLFKPQSRLRSSVQFDTMLQQQLLQS